MATTKKAATPKKPSNDSNTLPVHGRPGETEREVIGALAVAGAAGSAFMVQRYARGTHGELGIAECVKALKATTAAVQTGDLKHAEALLVGQATALHAIFVELARRAENNMGTYLQTTETYLRLALKAQAQSRATLETLAALKNPPVVFARQANFANGPQQVNNGSSPTRAPDKAQAHNEAGPATLPATEDGSTLYPTRGTAPPARELQSADATRPAG